MKQYYKQSKAIQETMDQMAQAQLCNAEQMARAAVLLNDFGFDFKKRTETKQVKDDGILKEFK